MNNKFDELIKHNLEPSKVLFQEPLSGYSTIGIGGPARYLYSADDSQSLINAINFAIRHKIPYYVLGNGSNTLISDEGFDGLVILNRSSSMKIIEHSEASNKRSTRPPRSRLDQLEPSRFFAFDDLDYDESGAPSVSVEIDSGFRLQSVIYKLIAQGITGLQWFAGIPGTIGGAVYINAHGGRHFISEYVDSATLIDRNGETKVVDNPYFSFDYDHSVLVESKEIIVSTVFHLKRGDKDRAMKTAQEWARRKSIQPQRSLGSTFQNLSVDVKNRHNLPSSSAGYIIDKLLHFRGTKRSGGAIVSSKSANFIENIDNATAKDVYTIISDIKTAAKAKIGIELKEEIQYLGKIK